MQMSYDLVLGLATALGLSAACGFRVFVPMLLASLGARAGYIDLGSGFDWIASTPALLAFGAATALEIAAYYVPAVDNLLDTVATPAAVVAAALLSAAVIVDVDPWLRWTLAIVAGGGIASAVQLSTVSGRAASSVTTLGAGNHVVATGELVGSSLLSALSVVAPFLVLIALALLALLGTWLWRRALRASRPPARPARVHTPA
jgi:hypothetical protein